MDLRMGGMGRKSLRIFQTKHTQTGLGGEVHKLLTRIEIFEVEGNGAGECIS